MKRHGLKQSFRKRKIITKYKPDQKFSSISEGPDRLFGACAAIMGNDVLYKKIDISLFD